MAPLTGARAHALEKEVAALRLLMSTSLGGVLWARPTRREIRAHLADAYGSKAAGRALRRVSQQLIVSCMRRMTDEFDRYLGGLDEFLATDAVVAAVDDLDGVDLGAEATDIVLQAVVHTALLRVCAARNIEAGCREAISLVHLAELSDEPRAIADLRIQAIGRIKSVARKGLRHGRKAMALAAARYEQEAPLAHVVQGLKAFAQGLADNLGPLALDGLAEAEQREDAPPAPRRRQPPPPASEDTDADPPPRGRRGRQTRRRDATMIDDEDEEDSQIVGVAASARQPREQSADIVVPAPLGASDDGEEEEEEEEADEDAVTPVRRNNGRRSLSATPKRGGRASRKATPQRQPASDSEEPSPTLPAAVRSAADGLDRATRAMRTDRGQDPLGPALRQSRRAGHAMYAVAPSARDATPIDESDDESDDRPALPSRPRHTALSRTEIESDGDSTPARYTHKRAGKNPFSRAEDKLLLQGLARFGWSEWARIHQVYFRGQSGKRTSESVKDRARYLEKCLRIKRNDYPPPDVRVRRAGPKSAVPAKGKGMLGGDEEEEEIESDDDEEEDQDLDLDDDEADEDEGEGTKKPAKKGTLDFSAADGEEEEEEENDDTQEAADEAAVVKPEPAAIGDSPPASPARTRARSANAGVGEKRGRADTNGDEKGEAKTPGVESANWSARKARRTPGSSGKARGRRTRARTRA